MHKLMLMSVTLAQLERCLGASLKVFFFKGDCLHMIPSCYDDDDAKPRNFGHIFEERCTAHFYRLVHTNLVIVYYYIIVFLYYLRSIHFSIYISHQGIKILTLDNNLVFYK